MLHLPRIMLAAPASGSGKTMLVCGLLQAFTDRGLRPASFKCGPDYIDPMFHTKVIGTKSKNLDTFFTGDEVTRYLFARTASQAGVSVLEGVMGIYDGLGGASVQASSYDLARATDTPVILVVNAKGMSLSVIPLIQGYLAYQDRLGSRVIRGVILNQTTKMTYLHLKEQIEKQTGVRLFGYVPRLADCAVESRHLGLVTPGEIADLRQRLRRLGGELEQCLDIDGILALAREAGDYGEETLCCPEEALQNVSCRRTKADFCDFVSPADDARAGLQPRIAVAMDEAFCFYYQDNLELLEEFGAKIVPFSPLRDTELPERVSAFLLGGGYPELYARQLSENTRMREQIARAVREGMPYLAECGGFMYLHDAMEDMEGTLHPMCGVISGNAFRTPKLGRFGYITVTARADGITGSPACAEEAARLLAAGQEIRGHEFHYFDSENPGEDCVAKKPGGRQWSCIHADARSMAGYPHLYYWSNPRFAQKFVGRAGEYAMRGKCSGWPGKKTDGPDVKKTADGGRRADCRPEGRARS